MISSLRHGTLVALGSVLLASCGGGGGGGSGGSDDRGAGTALRATFNTSAITFSAQAPFDMIELQKNVVGTVTQTGTTAINGTLYVLIEVPANSFFTVPEARIDSADSGHATVQVPGPEQIGVGTFEGSFRIRLCLNSQTCASGTEIQGSPHVVSVRYTVGDVLDADTVMPRTVLANTPGSVIVRGRGFTASTTVSLGGTAAASVTYVNPTQLRVQYPALPPGTHAITLNSGATAFNGSLVTVAATNYPYAWVPHRTNQTFPSALVYDAQRGSFVYATTGNGQSELLRYEYSGGNWVLAASGDGTFVSQLHMSHDGTRILALRAEQYVSTRLQDIDPTTLAIARETTIHGNTWSFALANDGNYVFGKRPFGSGGFLPPDLFGSNSRSEIVVDRISFNSMEAVASEDGSKVAVFGELNSGIGVYDPARFTWTPARGDALKGVWNYPRTTSADRTGTRFASLGVVVDGNMQPIGQVPGFFNAILSSDGSRLYVYDQGDLTQGTPTGRLRTFVVDAPTLPPTGNSHPRLAESIAPIVLADNPNGVATTSHIAPMALTPDGRSIIICGIAGCVVQPTPH